MKKKINILVQNLGNEYVAITSVHDEMNELTGFAGETMKIATERAVDWSIKNGYNDINIDFCKSQKQLNDFVFKYCGGWSKRF